MKDYLVTLHNGSKEYRSKCIRVKGKFYKREEDTVRVAIDGKSEWKTKNDPNVYYYEKEKKYIYSPGFSSSKNQYLTFDVMHKIISKSPNCNDFECIINGSRGFATKAYIKENKLVIGKSSGIYYDPNVDSEPRVKQSLLYSNLNYSYEKNRDYFCKFKEGSSLNSLDLLNPGYTYGVEIETCAGVVPSDKLLSQGILPVKDGSTPNYEYVTIPFKNLSSIVPVMETLREHCKFDISTSLHVHIGNVPTDPEFVTKFYKFMHKIQDELFTCFPKYKAGNYNGIKRREYTQKLPTKKTLGGILTFLNNGETLSGGYDGSRLDHRADPRRTNKWYISSRYYWVNLIPLIFYPSRTIEFRIHQGTLNKYKVFYWILLCMALVEYAKKHDTTRNVTISSVLKSVYNDDVAKTLISHFGTMKKYYQSYDEESDLGYKRDVIDDKTYKPKSLLF